jgi:uncharacterized OsmC-like protein
MHGDPNKVKNKEIEYALKKIEEKQRKRDEPPRVFEAINLKNGTKTLFSSQIEAAKALKLSPKSISFCLSKTQNSTEGYVFRYLDQIT